MALAALLAAGVCPGWAGPPAQQDPTRNCFWQLAHGRGADFACEYPAWLTDEERDDLRKLTREYLQDASCMVRIRIERSLVEEALAASDREFTFPPQPVACEIKLKDSVLPITATFAPKVVFKGGEAVEASPGLADVQGVNHYLAWPVVQYVNRAPGIRTEMIKMINAYRDRSSKRADARR